jgi:hypothetical protein
MAWVSLFNLFEPDKNFHGLLDGALETNVEVTITEFGKGVVTADAVGIVKELNGKKLKDIIASEISAPEWHLTRQGKLALYGMFSVDNHPSFENVIEIDISDWLSSLSGDELQAIADCTFLEWKRDKEISDDEKPIKHPKWVEDSFWKDNKKRNLLAQKEFFANIKHKQEGE